MASGGAPSGVHRRLRPSGVIHRLSIHGPRRTGVLTRTRTPHEQPAPVRCRCLDLPQPDRRRWCHARFVHRQSRCLSSRVRERLGEGRACRLRPKAVTLEGKFFREEPASTATTQRTQFENAQVRITRVRVAPGETLRLTTVGDQPALLLALMPTAIAPSGSAGRSRPDRPHGSTPVTRRAFTRLRTPVKCCAATSRPVRWRVAEPTSRARWCSSPSPPGRRHC